MNYELRYGKEYGNYKIVGTDDLEQAIRMYDKVKKFSERHGITMIIALWNKGWLIQSETVNPTGII